MRLRQEGEAGAVYDTHTDAHGHYGLEVPSLGRFRLEISAEGFEPYAADVYLGSDFSGHWAVQLHTKARH